MGYTGTVIVDSLKLVNSITGEVITPLQTKPNAAPDYIAPYVDTEKCAVTYNLDFPKEADIVATRTSDGTIEFEFHLPASVVKNLTQANAVKIMTVPTKAQVALSFSGNYYHGYLAGLSSSGTYTIQLKYFKGAIEVASHNYITQYPPL